MELTTRENEVLDLIINQKETVKGISYRLKISITRVYQIIEKLQEKKIIPLKKWGYSIGGGHSKPITPLFGANSIAKIGEVKSVRLHNEQFHITPFDYGTKWLDLLNKKVQIDGNTVIVYSKVLEVYSNISFYGCSADECELQSIAYWEKFFVKVENDFGCFFLKDRSQCVRRVRADWADVNNEFAVKADREKQKISIRDEVDGKVWLVADVSKGNPELQTVHPLSGKEDMDAIKPFMNTLRANPNVLGDLSKGLNALMQLIEAQAIVSKDNVQIVNSLATGLKAVVTIMKQNLEASVPKDVSETETIIKEDRPSYIG